MNNSGPVTFGEAVRFWRSLAARLLGWRPGEFWQATPAELLGSICDPEAEDKTAGPSRELIDQMLERDRHG
ncbi:phage tail assembly chaperone [Qipengyuania sp. ASV99]|uniref:phage tail assembly chaperone n=1 Tax=Qipengyuania sp. ASV99 TaxID=3399681 RepID=UPI003A4C7022